MTVELEIDGNVLEFPDEEKAKGFLVAMQGKAPPGGSPPERGTLGKAWDTYKQFQKVMAPIGAVGQDLPRIIDEPGRVLKEAPSQVLRGATFGASDYAKASGQHLAGLATGEGGKFSEHLGNVVQDQRQLEQDFPSLTAALTSLGTMMGGPAALAKTLTGGVSYGLGRTMLGNAAENVITGQALAPKDATGGERLLQGGLDVATGIGGPLVSRTVGKFSTNPSKMAYSDDAIPQVVNSQDQIAKETGIKVPIAPDDATRSAVKDTAGYVARKSPITSNILKKFGVEQREAISQVADTLEQRAGLSGRVTTASGPIPEKQLSPLVDDNQVVQSIVTKANQQWDDFKTQSNKMYADVQAMAPNETFVPTNLQKQTALFKNQLTMGLEGKGTPEAARVVDFISGKYKQASSFSDLQQLRSDLSSLAFEAEKPTERRMFAGLLNAINNDFDAMAKQELSSGNTSAAKALIAANKFYKDGNERFNIEVLDKVDELTGAANPFTTKGAQVLTTAIKGGDINSIKKIRSLVGEEDFKPLRDQFRQKLLRGDASDDYDIFGGDSKNPNANPLRRRIAALKNPLVLDEMLGKKDARLMRTLAAMAPYLQDATQAHANRNLNLGSLFLGGGLAAGATGAGAMLGIPAGVSLVGGAGLGNYILAKTWTSPKMQEYLIRTYRPGMGEEAIQRFTRRFVSQMIFGQLQEKKTVAE